ncbi:MAG: bifunctional aspartate kinase/diaminopimelate decarboxylase, partial [Balneolaceae bacterium]|nr:bifunctional aspartate kinase/diaminopimelate decarboxylase [Balneolaceae bacterium]
QAIVERPGSGQIGKMVETVEDRYRSMAEELDLDGEKILNNDFDELERISKGIDLLGEAGYRVEARLMALGELMATRLGAAFLKERGIDLDWLDVREYLHTIPQEHAGERARILSAVCDTSEDRDLQKQLQAKKSVVLTQGFVASDGEGKTVLLGRGGSDVSASYLAAKLGAERLEIWTDVPGMFSANPSQLPSARLLRKLSYEEAQEIATNGARVLHPRSIRPARRHGIPIHIRCTEHPELEGTVISSERVDDEALVKAIAVRDNVILVSMETLGMWQQVGFLADAFEVFKIYGLSIDLVSTSESNVTVSLDPGANTHFREIREDFVDDLRTLCRVSVIEGTAAVSLLGRHIRAILHQLGPAFEVFQEHHVYLLSQAANDLNFTFVVAADQADRLVRQLHEQVISQSGNLRSFGPTWVQMMGRESPDVTLPKVWWREKRDRLIDLAGEKGAAYVYDSKTIRETIKRLASLRPVDRIYYAMKANANKDVLGIIRDEGLGFECVSIGEVNEVLELFPDIDRDRILFTPNFAPREEYKKGLEEGVHVTLDNLFILKQWPELFEGRELFLRIDPGQGRGHHKHVRTGGIESKFGIPVFQIGEVREIIDRIGATVKGLHAHLGSGIKDPEAWKQTALELAEVAAELGTVEVLDVGGGLGVQENEMQGALDLDAFGTALEEFREAYPQFELWIEPGRYIVAGAGVLLARITQLKGKGNMQYVGVETGMNSFIRPALYGAHHTIVNLSKIDQPLKQLVNVVGPICESGDKLGIDRLFPESEEGDVVLIANTGAYGRVMSSTYNLRMPAEEVVI